MYKCGEFLHNSISERYGKKAPEVKSREGTFQENCSKTGKKIQRFFFQLRDLFHFIDVPRKKRRRGRGKNIENEDGLKTF